MHLYRKEFLINPPFINQQETFMKLGLGLGLSAHARAGQTSIINNAITLATGQSLQNHKFTQFAGAGDTAFLAEAALHFPGTTAHTNAAEDNQYLTKSSYDASGDTGGRYFWDDTTSLKGLNYISLIDPIANKSTYTALLIDLGQSDGVNASFPHSKAQYKTFYKEFLTQLRLDFPNATIFMNVLNRTALAGDFDVNYNLVRQAQLEIISEVSYVKKGIDSYDLPMVDNFHFTQSGTELYAEREARAIGKALGQNVTGANGPAITSLVSRTDRIEFTVSHDAGTDWSSPLSGNGQFAIEDDGTSANLESVTRTGATTGLILLPEGTAPMHGSALNGFVNYGDGGALGSTPDIALDNATNPMPFQSAANIAVTNGDPIQDLDNIITRLHARGCAKTYSSGNIVSGITALEGKNYSEYVAGEGPEFTDNYFRFARNTDRIIADSDFANSSIFTIGLCGTLPATIPSFSVFGGFANTAGTSSNNARLYLSSGGIVTYQAVNSGSGSLGSALSANDDFIIFLRFNSLTSMDGFVNTKTGPTNIDEHDTYSVLERWAFGNATNQPGFTLDYKLYDAFITSDAISNAEISDIYDFWEAEFGLTL